MLQWYLDTKPRNSNDLGRDDVRKMIYGIEDKFTWRRKRFGAKQAQWIVTRLYYLATQVGTHLKAYEGRQTIQFPESVGRYVVGNGENKISSEKLLVSPEKKKQKLDSPKRKMP